MTTTLNHELVLLSPIPILCMLQTHVVYPWSIALRFFHYKLEQVLPLFRADMIIDNVIVFVIAILCLRAVPHLWTSSSPPILHLAQYRSSPTPSTCKVVERTLFFILHKKNMEKVSHGSFIIIIYFQVALLDVYVLMQCQHMHFTIIIF